MARVSRKRVFMWHCSSARKGPLRPLRQRASGLLSRRDFFAQAIRRVVVLFD